MSKTKRPVGRPKELNDEVIQCAWAYVKGGFKEVPNVIPSIAGLAFVLGKPRNTLYAWAKENDEFSNILSAILTTQEMMLLDGGLGGEFNTTITKLILTKHGYSDKVETDHTSSDGSLRPAVIELVVADE